MTEYCKFGDFSVHREIDKIVDGFTIHQNWIYHDGKKFLTLSNLEDCKDVANVLSVYDYNNKKLKAELEDTLSSYEEENKQLKSTIAQLIEQNRKNNDLLKSDIRILEKALWCSSCENDYGRLRELRKEFLG